MSSAPNIDIKAMKKHLLERRKELEQVIEARAETKTDSELDQQRIGRLSRMDAIQQKAMEEETGRRRDQEVDRIKSAWQRIDEDDFGYCSVCEEPIAPKRLENDPATPLCVSCAGKAD